MAQTIDLTDDLNANWVKNVSRETPLVKFNPHHDNKGRFASGSGRMTSLAEWSDKGQAIRDALDADAATAPDHPDSRMTQAVQRVQGMDKPPSTVATQAELDALPGRKYYRGVLKPEQVEAFSHGPNWVGKGGSGTGLYTASNRGTASAIASDNPARLIEMVVSPKARLIDGKVLEQMRQKERYAAQKANDLAGQHLTEEIGRYASAMGYDGFTVQVPGLTSEGEDFLVLQNRAAVTVLDRREEVSGKVEKFNPHHGAIHHSASLSDEGELFVSMVKFNPNHDELGRFSSGSGVAWAVSTDKAEWANHPLGDEFMGEYKADVEAVSENIRWAVSSVGAPVVPVAIIAHPSDLDGNHGTVGWYDSKERGVLHIDALSEANLEFFGLHEYAHLLDAEHYGSGSFATGRSDSPLSAVMDTIRAAPQEKAWRYGPDAAYWGSGSEMFARAFAQYVAKKTGDEGMLEEVTSQWQHQWPDGVFEPISAEFDKLFESNP